MSQTLPTLFRHTDDYQRQLTLTPTGVNAVESASDRDLTRTIRAHAAETTEFRTGRHARDDGSDDETRALSITGHLSVFGRSKGVLVGLF
jgi:hypothetical protein